MIVRRTVYIYFQESKRDVMANYAGIAVDRERERSLLRPSLFA